MHHTLKCAGFADRLAAPFHSFRHEGPLGTNKIERQRNQWTVFFVLLILTIAVQASARRRGLERIEQRFDVPQWRHCHLALQLSKALPDARKLGSILYPLLCFQLDPL